MQHLIIFLSFYVGVLVFYLLCVRRFKSWKIGLLGSLFLILSPRIFAHSFYNSFDIPFLSVFVISIYTLLIYLDKKNFSSAFFHALACAILIDIRTLGVILPLFTLAFFILDLLLVNTRRGDLKKKVVSLFLHISCLIFFTVLFWPMLWERPLHLFIQAFDYIGKTNFPCLFSVLYVGKYIETINLPWHYISLWIIITTPVVITLCFFFGFLISMKSFIKNPLKYYLS
ncbi:glycosyltransferase family 39 protein, partial [Thermoproteota archaeon]